MIDLLFGWTSERPNVETALWFARNFPNAPNCLAIDETTASDNMRAEVGFSPSSLCGVGRKTSGDPEYATAIASLTRDDPLNKCKEEIRSVFWASGMIVVETGPRTREAGGVVHAVGGETD